MLEIFGSEFEMLEICEGESNNLQRALDVICCVAAILCASFRNKGLRMYFVARLYQSDLND